MILDRRHLLRVGSAAAFAVGMPVLSRARAQEHAHPQRSPSQLAPPPPDGPANHTIRIGTGLIELAPEVTISTKLYNGQFPGPLLRLEEGRRVVMDVHNDTDTPEQLHWHGQFLAPDEDGASEEGTPFIPAHGMRRIAFTPGPAGFRFYHTHLIAGADLAAGLYNGQAGPVYIEPRHEPGAYDREVFLTLKEFGPVWSRTEMALDFLAPETRVPELRQAAQMALRASVEKGRQQGYEVAYNYFSINGRMLGYGEPVRVKAGERVLFHLLNASASETRSLALPGHSFEVVALDGNPVPAVAEVPVLWLGAAERISAIVRMKHPGIWVLGDLMDEDRARGMGIVIEYAGATGKPRWSRPPPFRWDYRRFGKSDTSVAAPDEVIDMIFTADNAAERGFDRFAINGVSFSMKKMEPMFRLRLGKRYRLRMRNATDDIHPMHLHRHSFELTRVAGEPMAGVIKDVAMLGSYQEMEVDFTADRPGLSLFHCHMQMHMDFGLMALFDAA
jgi:FtsP/CotA-like multicopper oxidase with cupredoxin domain